jgi:4-amino-4-deoxy-L-arabinose transferase-like glycosyltransferase
MNGVKRPDGRISPAFLTGKHIHTLAIFLILVLALFLRLYRIESVPGGLSGDELFNAIDALRLGWGNWQVYFEGNNGREALFIYLMAVPLHLFPHEVWAVRLPAVLLGVGSVLVAYGIGRQQFNHRVGLAAALLITISLWPLTQARWGLRAVGLTFFTGLTIFLYGRALQKGPELKSWLLAGVAFGLIQYTYIPARIFPLVILGWFTWLAVTRWEQVRAIWRQLLFSFLAALLVFAPYGLYMVQNPDKVNQRVGALERPLEELRSGDLSVLVDTAATAVRIFAFEGDPAGRYHTSARPLFDPLTALLLVAGLLTTLVGAFRKGANEKDRRATNALLLLWTGVMVLPGAVTGLDTSSLRSAGAVVPAYLITALAVERLYLWLRQQRPNKKPLLRYCLIGLLVGGGLLTLLATWHSYFTVWANDPQVRDAYSVELGEIGRYLNENPPPENIRLYIALNYVTDSAPQIFAYYNNRPVTWFDHAAALPWHEGKPAWYIATNNKPLAPEMLAHLNAFAEPEQITFANGDPAFTIYKPSPDFAVSQADNTAAVAFHNGPNLVGFDMPETVFRGETIPLIQHWQIPDGQQPLPNQLTNVQVFLEDDAGNLWGQAEQLLGYPQAGWQPGDHFVQLVPLEIPSGMPPGPIYLRFGLRDWQGQPYEAIVAGEEEKNGPFLVRSRPLSEIALEPDTPVFDGILALQDHVFSTLVVPGLPVNISLDWLAVEAPPDDYRARLQLVEPGNPEPLVSQVFQLWPGVYPPSQWQKGEQVTTLHQLRIPLDISAETTLQLHLQLLPPDSETALPLTQGDTFLADLTLQIRDYLFEPPPIAHELGARFGEHIRLLGYDLDTAEARPDGQIHLTLYWQAIETPAAGYTVFNHLVGPDGQIHGQFDSPPVNDAWLTSTWLPGEVIIDRRVIPIRSDAPPGDYQINIGLYTASDLIRLPVWLNDQPQPGDQFSLTGLQLSP